MSFDFTRWKKKLRWLRNCTFAATLIVSGALSTTTALAVNTTQVLGDDVPFRVERNYETGEYKYVCYANASPNGIQFVPFDEGYPYNLPNFSEDTSCGVINGSPILYGNGSVYNIPYHGYIKDSWYHEGYTYGVCTLYNSFVAIKINFGEFTFENYGTGTNYPVYAPKGMGITNLRLIETPIVSGSISGEGWYPEDGGDTGWENGSGTISTTVKRTLIGTIGVPGSGSGGGGLTDDNLNDLKDIFEEIFASGAMKVDWAGLSDQLKDALKQLLTADGKLNIDWGDLDSELSAALEDALLDANGNLKVDWSDLTDRLDKLFSGEGVKINWAGLDDKISAAISDALLKDGYLKIDWDKMSKEMQEALENVLNNSQVKVDWSTLKDYFPNGFPVDWSNLPMQDIAAPVINVTRSVDVETPVSSDVGVTLTITATDTNHTTKGGHYTTDEGPIKLTIDGKTFTASGDGSSITQTIKVTKNRTVSVTATDGNGNTKDYNIVIDNIDSVAPTINALTKSTDAWTRDPVTIYADATDDQGLASEAYRWFFQSTTSQGSGAPTKPTTPIGDWTSSSSFQCTEPGNVWVEIKDSSGKITASEPILVRNIDKIAPTIDGYEIDPESGQVNPEVGATVTVNITNTGDPASGLAAPLDSLLIQWNDDEPWKANTSITVHENTTLNVRVRDSLGNVSEPYPITVNAIVSDKPAIGGFTTSSNGEFVKPPIQVSVEASKGSGENAADLAEKPFSWDGGKTWLLPNDVSGGIYRSDITINTNGQYTVLVRDNVGNISESTIVISNIDDTKPTLDIHTYKGLPDNWDAATDGEGTPDDYVWRLRVTAEDTGSGLRNVQLHFGGENASVSPDQLPFTMELQEPGIYGATAYDNAGNSTYAEKNITYEALGEAGGAGSNSYVDIKTPPGGTGGGAFEGAAVGDLVYAPEGVYNKKTEVYRVYSATPSKYEGIQVNFTVSAPSTHYLTGYADFNSNRYVVSVSGSTSPVRGEGSRELNCTIQIPAAAITQDVLNGRLIVTMQEWDSNPGDYENSKGAKLSKEGTATLYLNTQKSSPKVNYLYNRNTDELTIVASSAVAGIANGYPTVDLGSGPIAYTAPIRVNGATTITIVAQDNTQHRTEEVLDGTNLAVSGEGGGSLPTTSLPEGSGVPSMYSSGRGSEIYIINGTRSNTDTVPSDTVMNSILGGS